MSKRNLENELSKLSIINDENRLVSPIIETHCHLDYLRKGNETDEIISKSQALGIERLITISVQPNNLDAAFSIAQTYENVWCTQGVHPHEAKLWTPESHQTVRERMTDEKVVAVGEIGLDYHYDNSPRDVQRDVFEHQLALSIEVKKPVVIHSRDADDDTIAILKNFEGSLRGVIHSFTSGKELAEYALGQGLFLGFNGIISFKSAENVREILRITPLKQMLLETDSPFLTPVPFRGKENAPFYLPFVADALLKEVSEEPTKALEQIYMNSIDLFF